MLKITNYVRPQSLEEAYALCQKKNNVILGGSLYGRFGFSDVLTLFQGLDAKVELYNRGILDMEAFANLPRGTRDVLVRVIVPKEARKVVYEADQG